MTPLDRDIKTLILKVIFAATGPVQDFTLRAAIRNSYIHVAFTEAELGGYIKGAEETGWLAGSRDELFGLVWGLTPKGQNKAQQLL